MASASGNANRDRSLWRCCACSCTLHLLLTDTGGWHGAASFAARHLRQGSLPLGIYGKVLFRDPSSSQMVARIKSETLTAGPAGVEDGAHPGSSRVRAQG